MSAPPVPWTPRPPYFVCFLSFLTGPGPVVFSSPSNLHPQYFPSLPQHAPTLTFPSPLQKWSKGWRLLSRTCAVWKKNRSQT